MSKRLEITVAHRGDGSGVGIAARWLMMAHQGEWGCPILTFRGKSDESLTPECFVAHCAGRYEDLVERMRRKAERGIAVWLDGEPIDPKVLLPLLDRYCVTSK